MPSRPRVRGGRMQTDPPNEKTSLLEFPKRVATRPLDTDGKKGGASAYLHRKHKEGKTGRVLGLGPNSTPCQITVQDKQKEHNRDRPIAQASRKQEKRHISRMHLPCEEGWDVFVVRFQTLIVDRKERKHRASSRYPAALSGSGERGARGKKPRINGGNGEGSADNPFEVMEEQRWYLFPKKSTVKRNNQK